MSHPTPRHNTSSLVKIGNDDPTLTGHAGLLLTGELVRRLEVVRTIEEAVNRVRPFKQRQRGLKAGELMVSLAAELLKGSASEKPGAAGLLRRALQALPAGHGPVSLRVDSGSSRSNCWRPAGASGWSSASRWRGSRRCGSGGMPS